MAFEKSMYRVDDDVTLWVYIRCKSQFALRFSKLSVQFNDEVCTVCTHYDDGYAVYHDGNVYILIEVWQRWYCDNRQW